MTEPFPPKHADPPLLYDLVMSGERVRQAGGPWLGEEVQEDSLITAPAPPSLQTLWQGTGTIAPVAPDNAPGETERTPPAAAQPAPPPPQTIAEIPAELRATIERQTCRRLAKHFRQEITARLDQAMQQSHEPVRKAIEDALVSAVANTRKTDKGTEG